MTLTVTAAQAREFNVPDVQLDQLVQPGKLGPEWETRGVTIPEMLAAGVPKTAIISMFVKALPSDKARLFACDCVERVLPLYEYRWPADMRPRSAIHAVRASDEDQIASALVSSDQAYMHSRKARSDAYDGRSVMPPSLEKVAEDVAFGAYCALRGLSGAAVHCARNAVQYFHHFQKWNPCWQSLQQEIEWQLAHLAKYCDEPQQ